MKFNEITIQFESQDNIIAEELVCNIFFSFSLKGVVCNVPIPEPDEGFGTDTLARPRTCSVTGYLPMIDSSDIIIEKIRQKAYELGESGIRTQVRIRPVDEQDWAEAWKQYFEVTRITDRLVVKPLWKKYMPDKNEIIIHLDPGMAFGTGTHPTTAMCLELIESNLVEGDDFLDIGTGSGILMIAAAKLGAAHMTGIDTDELAVEVAGRNLEINGIAPETYDLKCAGIDSVTTRPFRLIAANIIAGVIVHILPMIAQRMTEKSTAIISGILKEQKNEIKKALESCSLGIIQTICKEEWISFAIKKKE
jgi:ribosomal protein L11 methyltransferase